MKTSNMILLFTSRLSVIFSIIHTVSSICTNFSGHEFSGYDAEYRVVQSCLNLPINNAPIFGDLL